MVQGCHFANLKVICLFLVLTGCSHLIYQPSQGLHVDSEKLDPKPQQIEFKTDDGNKIIGWYFRPASNTPKARILFFHGNGQNLSSHFIALYWILKHDYEFMIFDYPGYGGSEGDPDQKSVAESGIKAVEWISKRDSNLPLVIFGQSLGGNVAMYTTVKAKESVKPCMVVVESTFKSYKKVGQRILASHWWTWPFQWMSYLVVPENYSAKDEIGNLAPTPLIVIHGDRDAIVAEENGQDVFAAAKEPKAYWPVPGGGHISAFVGDNKEELRQKLLSALAKNCPQAGR